MSRTATGRLRGGFIPLALTVVVGLAAVGAAGAASAAGPSSPPVSAAANPYAPAYGHPYRHGATPTREAAAASEEFVAAYTQAVQSCDRCRY